MRSRLSDVVKARAALETSVSALVAASVLFFGGTHVFFQHAIFLSAILIFALHVVVSVWWGWCLPLNPYHAIVGLLLAVGVVQAELRISDSPEMTRQALSRYGAAALVFVLTSRLATDEKTLLRCSDFLIGLAVFETLYGIAERFTGHECIWLWPKTHYIGSVTGTYVNRNHFAGLLACATPVALGRAFVGPSGWSDQALRFWTKLSLALERPAFWRRVVFVVAAAVCTLGTCVSLSRGGLVSLVAGALVFNVLLASKSGRRTTGIVTSIALVGLAGLGLMLYGPGDLLGRVSALPRETEGHENSRLAWAQSTLAMIADHPWFGVGLGNFEGAFRRYQHGWISGLRIDHAHNDMLELCAETGIPLVLLCVTALVYLVYQALRRARISSSAPLIYGIAAALAAVVTHAFLDFDLQLAGPLNVAAVICGLLVASDLKPQNTSRTPVRLLVVLATLVVAPVLILPTLHRLRAELVVHPTVREVDDQRSAATRLAALEVAIALCPENATYRLEAAELRYEVYEADIENAVRRTRCGLQDTLTAEGPSAETLVSHLRRAIGVGRSCEERTVRDRARVDLRAAELDSPADPFVLADLALLAPDSDEARRASMAAVTAFPDGAETLMKSALGRLRFNRNDALAHRWLAHALQLAPELRRSAYALAAGLAIEDLLDAPSQQVARSSTR